MTEGIVFEGATEVIIGLKKNSKKLKQLWFDEGGRNTDDYDVYTFDLSEGLSIDARTTLGSAKSILEGYGI